jgi:hypothetical protein
MNKFRQAGERLGAYIRASDPSTQQIQALLADLLADDELQQPMRDAVSRPRFASLRELAGTGGGSVQREALLQELARSYLPKVVDGIRDVMNGMLNLAAKEVNLQGDFNSAVRQETDPWESPTTRREISTSSEESLTVKDFAKRLGIDSSEVIQILLSKGVIATAAQIIDATAARIVRQELSKLASEDAGRDATESKRLGAAEICDETIWNRQRDPEIDKRFLEAWNLRWFNKRYRPRLERD